MREIKENKKEGKRLAQLLSNEYGINNVDIKLLRDGPDNVFWDVGVSNEKRYALRVSKRNFEDTILFESEWLCFLKQNNISVVSIVRTKDNKTNVNLSDKQIVTVFDFIEGKELNVNTKESILVEAAKSAGKALAKLHSVSRNHKKDLLRKRTIFTELERAVENKKIITEKIPEGKNFLVEAEEMLLWSKSQKYTPVLVHNDYRINNVIFDKQNQVLAIIDFDWACVGPAIKDVAHSLVEWSLPDKAKNHNKAVFNTFLESYNNFSDEPIKKNHSLIQWISFGCLSDACTFIVDRLLEEKLMSPSSCYMYNKYKYFSSVGSGEN